MEKGNEISLTTEEKQFFKSIGININTRRFRRFYKAGLLNDIDTSFIDEIQHYWKKNYGKEIDPSVHLAFANITGKKDPRVIPGREMWKDIIPYFNDMNIKIGYSDKNIYDKLVSTSNSAKTILKRVRGHYFTPENMEIDASKARELLLKHQSDFIIKPSDTDNGKGVEKIKYLNGEIYLNDQVVTMEALEKMYGFNFIIQDVIRQHPIMAAPHPNSVNSLRMVTFRWDNDIKYLLTFARFGANNSVRDNAGTGGLCIGITDKGEFMDFAVDEDCQVYTHHPTTNYDFTQYTQIPNFEKFKQFVIDLHKDILHHDFVSWDIAVGLDGEPVFIEANYRGATWLYQLAAQRPLFGDFTEDVIKYVSKELKTNQFARNVNSNMNKIKSKNQKLQNENKKLNNKLNESIRKLKEQEKLIKQKENEIKNLKRENQLTKSSKSWKITAPLRKINNIIKK